MAIDRYTVLSDGRNIGGGLVRTQSDLDYQMQKYRGKGLEVKKNRKGALDDAKIKTGKAF